MISVAKLIIQERNISVNESDISAQMTRVMDLEKEIANVRKKIFKLSFKELTFFIIPKRADCKMSGSVPCCCFVGVEVHGACYT